MINKEGDVVEHSKMIEELNSYYGSDKKVGELMGRSEMYINLLRRGISTDMRYSDLKKLKKLHKQVEKKLKDK